ncbi:MAG TPA: uracil-DNA glycosylase [Balneolaceae bacterium]|nr:uracil-DNA glycosylase [Balneolaceae bacterium]
MTDNSGTLIDDIITFLKNERKLYGDFNITAKSAETITKGKFEQSENRDNPAEQSVKESSQKQTANQNQARMASSKSQDPSFIENEEDREIYNHIDECHTLDELQKLCKKADVLKTDLEGTNLVFGVGNPDADLMLIGEAPGAEEDRQGEPFVGRAGQLLNKILAAIDFKREEVYIGNILKHRPPQNRNPSREERRRSLPFLLRQIDLVNPKLILCLGKVAAQTLLENNNSLSSMREKFHSFRGKYELMATYHPAALLRHPKWKRPTWEDVQLLRKRYDELGCKP